MRLPVLLLVEWQSHSPVLLPVVEQLHLRGASVRGVAVAHSVPLSVEWQLRLPVLLLVELQLHLAVLLLVVVDFAFTLWYENRLPRQRGGGGQVYVLDRLSTCVEWSGVVWSGVPEGACGA